MNLKDLIEALDQRYGNPYAVEECGLIQEAITRLYEQGERIKELEDIIEAPTPVKTYTGGKPNRVTKGDDDACNGK